VAPEEVRQVRAPAQHVVAAGMGREGVGLQGFSRGNLHVDDLVEELPADCEGCVLDRLAARHCSSHPIRPSEVFAVRADVVRDTFGEGIPDTYQSHAMVTPPSTTTAWPVMYPAAGLARNTTVAASSGSSPMRPSRIRCCNDSRYPGRYSSVISVGKK